MTCYDCEMLRENVDSFIKEINRRISDLGDLPAIADEHSDNIQHNYELIYELKDKIEELTQEINALKFIQVITLKQTTTPLLTETEHKKLKDFEKEAMGKTKNGNNS